MTTRVIKLFNQMNRFWSGANLNFFRCAAIVVVLGVSECAWAGHGGPHYASVLAKSTGDGKVYLTTTNNYSVKSTDWKTEMSDSWDCGDSGDNDSRTYYYHAKANDGYVFAGWSTNESTNTQTSTDNPYSATTKATATSSSSPTTGNYYAYFWQPKVSSATCPDDLSVSVKGESKTATITFNVIKAMSADNFTGTPTLGSGFTVQSGPTASIGSDGSGTVSYVLQYTAGAVHGESSATVSLRSNYDAASEASCTVSANFPNITISGANPEVPVYDVMPTESVEGTATFNVAYAATDGSDFIQWPLVPVSTAGYDGWSITSCTFSDGVVTVEYSFDPNGTYGTHTANLTLAASSNAGGASKTLELGVVIEEPSDKAAVVTLGGYEKEWDTLVEALADANSHEGCTLKLLNNCEVNASQTFTKSMTLDLNGFNLKRAGITTEGETLLLNTSGKTLYITDNKPGAKGSITAVASSSVAVTGIRVGNGCKLLMDKGSINVTTPGTTARGIYSTTTPTSENMVVVSNVTINTSAASQSIGIDCESSTATDSGDPEVANVILSNVTVNAETTETTDAYAIRTAKGVALLVNSGTYSATAATQNTYAIHSSGYTAVVNGTFNATSTTRTAFGIYVNGGITAVKGGTITASAATAEVHATKILDKAKLLTYGGTFRGICTNVNADGWASGTQVVSGGTLEAQGGTFIGEIAKTGLEAAQLSYGVGIYANTGSNVSLSSATLRGQTDNTYLNGGHAFYTKTANAVSLTNCTLEVFGQYQYGYGIRNNGTPLSVKNSTITINTVYAYNYGVYQEGNTTTDVENTTITCESGSVRAHAIWVNNGQVNAINCSLNAKTKQSTATAEGESNLRAIYVNTGKKVTLNGCMVTAKGNANYSQNGYGLYIDGSADIDNTTVTVSDVKTNAYTIGNTSNTTLIAIGSGKFSATATGGTIVSTNGTAAAAKQQLYGGYYKQNTNLAKYLPAGYGVETLPSSSTEYEEGYRYAIRATEDVGTPVCKIGSTPYTTLEEALEYASKNASNSNKLTILMTANYTLPAGNYTLSQYTTLLVPYDGQTSAMGTTIASNLRSNTRTNPSVNLKLTFATGANLTAFGVIETGGREYDANGGTQTGGVNGKFGQIALNSGSHIDLENGSKLQCWGYITGAGTITAKSGSQAYEHFEFGVNKGGTIMSGLISNTKGVFAVDDYFYQNIEAEITYKPGSQAFASSGMYIQGNRAANGVKMVGSSNEHLFKMSTDEVRPNMWVRKKYDPTTDRCTWTLNDGAQFSSINITISGYGMNSSNFVLPIASSMDIVMNYGTLAISSTQKVMLIPGSRMIIKKDATLQIPSGTKFYVWDVAQWNLGEPVHQYVYSALYQPTRSSTNPRAGILTNKTNLPSGEIYVQGTLEVSGDLQTTTGGAYIHSTNDDAGQIVYKTNATASGTVYQYTTGKNYTASSTTSAKLQNGDGTYEETAGTTNGDKWIYRDDKWVKVSTSGCFVVETISGTPHYYAHPKDWVEVTANTPDDHAYHVTADPTRFVIQGADCNWIEVVKDGDDYTCINENSIYYGSYFEWSESNGYWVEKKVSISFNNQASVTTYNNIPYKTKPQYAGATPTQTATSSEYYTWLGWTKGSTDGEFFAKDAELPEATENTTYYAYFETHKFEYTISFKNYDEAVLEAKRWAHGEIPTYDGTPVKPSTTAKEYTHDGWSTSKNGSVETIPAATAAATYYAHFAESDRKYTVQWVNYNGTVLKEEQVAYNITPSAPAMPTRPNDDYYTYTFNAWSPTISAVTGNQTYTATYNYEKKVNKHEVLFKNGTTTIFSQNLVGNTVPVFDGNEPTKDATAQYSYTFDGWSTTNGGALVYAKNAALPALTADVTYYAHFVSTTNTYKVLWKSEDGKQLLETDAAVTYNETPEFNSTTPTKANLGTTIYVFDGWSATVGGAKLNTLPKVTEDKVFYAHFSVAVASVTADGTDYYTTLSDAFTAAKTKNNATIKMLQDVSLGASSLTYDGANTCTLDLNGHTISGTSNLLLIIDNASANFTITDNSESKLGKLSMNTSSTVGAAFCAQLKKGKLYLEAGTIYLYTTSSSKNAVGARVDAGEFIMNGGTVHTVATQNNIVAHGVQPLNTAQATINGGTVRAESANGVGSGMYVTGTITVNGGKFYVTGKTAYMVHEATTDPTKVKIQGGYYNINTNVANCATAPYYVRETTVEEKTEVGGDYNYQVVEKYTVTFKDGDNNTIQSGLVEKGQTPVYTGATPTKTATAQYTYTFNNTWSPAISEVTEAATYTAQFNNTVNSYEITWLNDDNSLIDKTTVEYGVVPTHADAEKVNTAEWTYTFTGWNIDPVAVTGNATYKATFSQAKNTYTVTWKDADGTPLETDENVEYGATPTYNGATPSKEADEDYTYTFNGWTPTVGQIEGTTVYTATYTSTPNVASVTAGETTYYTTLPDAFTAAKAKTNPTIKLLQNVSMGATPLTYDGANICTLDLNGHEISGTARILLIIDNASTTFTITDNTESKLGKLSLTTAPTDKAAFCADLVNGTLKLEAGTIYLYSTSSNQNAVGARIDGGEFIMNGGTVHTVATQNNRVAHGVQPLNSAQATINGGTVRAESANGVGSGMYVTGTITVNGGKFYVSGQTAYIVHEGTLNATKVKIQGGYYNISTNVANCATAPYYVRETTVEEKTEVGGDYNYRVVEKYPVTFKDGDNKTIQSGLIEKGQTPVYTGETPTKAADEDRTYTFNDTWSPAISAVTAAATYTAQFNSILNNLTVGVSTIETVSTPRRTRQLIIESNGEQSGELLQAENLTVDDDAYFDLTIPGGVQPRDANGKATWYAIGVPWQVKALEGILLDGKPLTWRTCKILYYNSAERAANGPSDKCWTLLEDDGTAEKVLQPGRLYMIAFNRTGTTIRFVKKAGASINNTSINVELYGNSNTNPTDANWNGIANPSTFKAYLNAESHINYDQYGDHYGQKYIPSSNTYEPFKMDANKLVVGQPIFVQATTNKPIVANATAYNSNIAARRNAPTENSNGEYELRITPESQNNCTDKIYLKVSDDKQDKYIIGQDLAKAGVSSKVAQMWVNRYDAKLCVNTMEPTNNTVVYPLGIYAPKAGDYCLSLAQSVQNGDAVYLTIDGTPIWNIGNSGYYLSLSEGTESRYGLLIVRRNTPATPTDLDTIGETENNSVQKIVLDGKVYILRNGEVFTITGQQIL